MFDSKHDSLIHLILWYPLKIKDGNDKRSRCVDDFPQLANLRYLPKKHLFVACECTYLNTFLAKRFTIFLANTDRAPPAVQAA